VRRILVVDDEPSIRDAMESVLVDEGYVVETAADGRAALALIATSPLDLLITDVMMPDLDGWTLLARAREHAPALPVILISAIERREATQRQVLITDHTVFLRKPFTIEALLTTVERLTGSRPT
jgi:CheY-like chemotaxis protein